MTSAGALNICPANPVDPPAPSAPGPGNPSGSRAFGQQLRDANDSLRSSHEDPGDGSTVHPTRAAARHADKKQQGDSEVQVSVPLPAVPAQSPVQPLSLHLALFDANVSAPDSDPVQAAPADPAVPLIAQSLPIQTDPANAPANAPADAVPVPATTADPLAAASQTRPGTQDVSFAVKVAPQPDAAAAPLQPAPVDAQVKLKLDDAASQGDPAKENLKPGSGDAGAIHPAVSKTVSPAAVTAVKESRRTDNEPDTTAPAPRTQVVAQVNAFQPPSQGPRVETANIPKESTVAHESSAIQTPAADPIAKPSAPLKDLSIQIGQTQQDRVEVRVVERAGELQVAVRAANADVSQGLRQGLSDLVNRLEQNGFRAEAWRPGATVSTVQGTADTRQKSAQFQNDGSQSQSGSQQGRQQNQQNQTPRPRWVQELEGRLTGDDKPIAGGSYGLSTN